MALPGKNALVKVNGETILEINDASFSVNGEIVDVSAFGQDGFRERLANLIDANVSMSGFYNPSDTTGQNVLRTAAVTGAKVDGVEVLADGTNGFKADCLIETFEVSPAVEGAVPVSISLQSTGEVEVV